MIVYQHIRLDTNGKHRTDEEKLAVSIKNRGRIQTEEEKTKRLMSLPNRIELLIKNKMLNINVSV